VNFQISGKVSRKERQRENFLRKQSLETANFFNILPPPYSLRVTKVTAFSSSYLSLRQYWLNSAAEKAQAVTHTFPMLSFHNNFQCMKKYVDNFRINGTSAPKATINKNKIRITIIKQKLTEYVLRDLEREILICGKYRKKY